MDVSRRKGERVTTWASFYSLAGPGEPYYTDDPSLSAKIQEAASETVGGASQFLRIISAFAEFVVSKAKS